MLAGRTSLRGGGLRTRRLGGRAAGGPWGVPREEAEKLNQDLEGSCCDEDAEGCEVGDEDDPDVDDVDDGTLLGCGGCGLFLFMS